MLKERWKERGGGGKQELLSNRETGNRVKEKC